MKTLIKVITSFVETMKKPQHTVVEFVKVADFTRDTQGESRQNGELKNLLAYGVT